MNHFRPSWQITMMSLALPNIPIARVLVQLVEQVVGKFAKVIVQEVPCEGRVNLWFWYFEDISFGI